MKTIYIVLNKGKEEERACSTRERAEKWMADNARNLYMPRIATEEVNDEIYDMLVDCESREDEFAEHDQ